MSAPGWIEGARLCNSSQPTYFQPAYKTERRPCTQLLWWPQLPEKLGQVKLGQRRQEGFFQEGALVRRLMPRVEGDSRPRIEAYTGGGCRTRLGTHTGTEAGEAWVSQMGACLGYFSHALKCQALYLPSLSIPDPFFLVYLQKRARSNLNGAKGSKHLRNATVEVAEVPAGGPRGSRSPESRSRAATGAWRLLGPEQGTGRMSPETWREAATSTHVQMRSGHHGQWE